MSILSDILDSHRDLADMWDALRADMESEEEPLVRLGIRALWFGVFVVGAFMAFLIFGISGMIFSLGNSLFANITGFSGAILWVVLWFSVWIRSYTMKDDEFTN